MGEPWNGYRYWMAYTPYPNDARENPCIVASNDKRVWVVPEGLTNPIFSTADAVSEGYSYNSDTHLVRLTNGDLRCYFRPFGVTAEAIYAMDSSDGVTWGAAVLCLSETSSSGNRKLLSPAVVQEADSSWTMWTGNRSTGKIERRTSADGLTWSDPSDCVVSGVYGGGSQPWHLDVVRVDDTYYMLGPSDVTRALHFWSSNDGLRFTGSSAQAVPLSGEGYDARGYYRSALLARPDGRFDVWGNSLDGAGGGTFTNDAWRITLIEGIDLASTLP